MEDSRSTSGAPEAVLPGSEWLSLATRKGPAAEIVQLLGLINDVRFVNMTESIYKGRAWGISTGNRVFTPAPRKKALSVPLPHHHSFHPLAVETQ